jgi:hypothetical protein
MPFHHLLRPRGGGGKAKLKPLDHLRRLDVAPVSNFRNQPEQAGDVVGTEQ